MQRIAGGASVEIRSNWYRLVCTTMAFRDCGVTCAVASGAALASPTAGLAMMTHPPEESGCRPRPSGFRMESSCCSVFDPVGAAAIRMPSSTTWLDQIRRVPRAW
jgi:hypothetical protein